MTTAPSDGSTIRLWRWGEVGQAVIGAWLGAPTAGSAGSSWCVRWFSRFRRCRPQPGRQRLRKTTSKFLDSSRRGPFRRQRAPRRRFCLPLTPRRGPAESPIPFRRLSGFSRGPVGGIRQLPRAAKAPRARSDPSPAASSADSNVANARRPPSDGPPRSSSGRGLGVHAGASRPSPRRSVWSCGHDGPAEYRTRRGLRVGGRTPTPPRDRGTEGHTGPDQTFPATRRCRLTSRCSKTWPPAPLPG